MTRMTTLTPIPPEIELLTPVVFAKDQPEYLPLPASRTPEGEVVTCWKMDWKARLKVLFGGKIYITMLTFNKPLTPFHVTVDKPAYSQTEISS